MLTLIKSDILQPVCCCRVVSTSTCQAGGLWFKSSIIPLLKHACGESDWLLCWLYTPAEVSHQRWISGNVYHIHLHKVRIRQNPLWLWNPEETSPEVQNRGISGPKNGHVSNKNGKKKSDVLGEGFRAFNITSLLEINQNLLRLFETSQFVWKSPKLFCPIL